MATDLAAVAFDVASPTLLVLSQESSRLLRVAPETGAILDQRALSGSPQYEGEAIGRPSSSAWLPRQPGRRR